MNKMIVLTGNRGFIGKHFLSNIDGKEEIIKVEQENIKDFLTDFNDWKNVSLIIHQGAISSTTEKNINLIHEYNVSCTLKILENAILYGIPVKYASSASIYGNTVGQINPLNFYAISKLQIDYFVLDNIDRFSHIQGFRYFNVYGQGEEHKGNQSSPVSKFSKQIKETGKLKLFENSENFYRDFVCVNDLVDIVLNNKESSGIYDLGTGNPISFEEVARNVIDRFGGEIEYVPFPDNLKGKYQTYTKADMKWIGEYDFTKVSDYLKLL